MCTNVYTVQQLKEAIENKVEFITLNEGIYELVEPIIIENLADLRIVGKGKVVISGASKKNKKGSYPNSIFVNNQRRYKSRYHR